jgi:hypothetical protein
MVLPHGLVRNLPWERGHVAAGTGSQHGWTQFDALLCISPLEALLYPLEATPSWLGLMLRKSLDSLSYKLQLVKGRISMATSGGGENLLDYHYWLEKCEQTRLKASAKQAELAKALAKQVQGKRGYREEKERERGGGRGR